MGKQMQMLNPLCKLEKTRGKIMHQRMRKLKKYVYS